MQLKKISAASLFPEKESCILMSTANLKKFRKQKITTHQEVDMIEMLTALVCIMVLAAL